MQIGESLTRRWMPGFRQGPEKRPAWAHPQDLVLLLKELRAFQVKEAEQNAVSPSELFQIDLYYAQLYEIAWLHDLLEDGVREDGQKVQTEDLRFEGVPNSTIDSVLKLSQKEDESKIEYLSRLRDTLGARTATVKCVDRICNLREGSSSFKEARWARYVKETHDYILPLLDLIPGPEKGWLESRLQEALALRPVKS